MRVQGLVNRAMVRLLFLTRGPSAVAGFIVPVIVYPVDGLAFRPFAHVGEKVYEGLPTLADRDSLAPVVFVIQVVATSKHAHPGVIGRCEGTSMGMTMCCPESTKEGALLKGDCLAPMSNPDGSAHVGATDATIGMRLATRLDRVTCPSSVTHTLLYPGRMPR